jgi:hypothetical protein
MFKSFTVLICLPTLLVRFILSFVLMIVFALLPLMDVGIPWVSPVMLGNWLWIPLAYAYSRRSLFLLQFWMNAFCI